MDINISNLDQLFVYSKMHLTNLVTLTAILGQTSVFASQKYWDRSITLLIPEGQEDCYFLPNIKAMHEVDVEFQVSLTKKTRLL